MAHLLVLENWMGGTGYGLLRAISRLGHDFTFVTRDVQRYLRRLPPHGAHPLLAASEIIPAETSDIDGLLGALARRHAARPFDGVVTQCDYYLEHTARVAEHLGLLGPGARAMARTRQKHLMRQALADAGVPNPAFRVTQTWEDTAAAATEIGYPLVLKPVDEGGGMFVTCIRNEAELAENFQRLDQFRVNTRAGRLVGITGADILAETPGVVELSLKPVDGSQVELPRENLYLGHVLYADRYGHAARTHAEWAASQITLLFAEDEAAVTATRPTAGLTANPGV